MTIMPRTCTICVHDKHEEINQALVKGTTLRTIADHWSVTKTSLIRHKADHLPAALVKANGAAEAAHGDGLLAKLESIEGEARALLKDAKEAKDLRAALMAVRELTRLVDLLAWIRGELQDSPTVINVQVLAPVILGALEAFPEARAAVACRLSELDSQGGNSTLGVATRVAGRLGGGVL